MSGSDTQLTYVDRPQPEPYIMTPRDMIEQNKSRPLSMTARVVRIYLHDLSKRPGWRIYVTHVQRALDLSPGVWARARRELEAAGYYRAERLQDPATGKWMWRHFIYRDPIAPSPSPKESIPPKPMDGPSSSGHSGDIRTLSSSLTTKRSSRSHGGTSVASAAANDQRRVHVQNKKWRERPSGIVCWYPGDHDFAQEIEASIQPDEIAAAVEVIRAAGKDPVPGLVKKEVERARASRHKAQQAELRKASGPLAEAKRWRAEMEMRKADPIARQAALEAMREATEKLKF